MALGSYIRFFLGIILSLEIIRLWFTGSTISSVAIVLSIIYVIFVAAYFAFRF